MKSSELINIGSKLLREKNINSHKLDTEIILSHILKVKREQLLIREKEISHKDFNIFNKMLNRRLKKEPIAYITNKKEFRSKNIYVASNALIPRPETELLIDPLIRKFKGKNLFFLDVGIGSGCIIYSLLHELNKSRGIGIDICNKALSIAKINLDNTNVGTRANLQCKSIDQVFNVKFDLVISNPPYIVRREINQLSEDIKNFEPKRALNGGNDGLDVIKKVIYKSKNILKRKGMLALEIGNEQYNKVSKILRSNKFKTKYLVKDYRENVRCILSILEN